MTLKSQNFRKEAWPESPSPPDTFVSINETREYYTRLQFTMKNQTLNFDMLVKGSDFLQEFFSFFCFFEKQTIFLNWGWNHF